MNLWMAFPGWRKGGPVSLEDFQIEGAKTFYEKSE